MKKNKRIFRVGYILHNGIYILYENKTNLYSRICGTCIMDFLYMRTSFRSALYHMFIIRWEIVIFNKKTAESQIHPVLV